MGELTTNYTWITWRTVSGEHRVDVTVTFRKSDMSIHSVTNQDGYNVGQFMTTDQLKALRKQCLEEMDRD